jgi:hypothetical protein
LTEEQRGVIEACTKALDQTFPNRIVVLIVEVDDDTISIISRMQADLIGEFLRQNGNYYESLLNAGGPTFPLKNKKDN